MKGTKLGYSYSHISNNDWGDTNPGTDNQALTFLKSFKIMSIKDCYSFEDFRKLAKQNLPAPIFHYIDGGSDDETTLKRNTEVIFKM